MKSIFLFFLSLMYYTLSTAQQKANEIDVSIGPTKVVRAFRDTKKNAIVTGNVKFSDGGNLVIKNETEGNVQYRLITKAENGGTVLITNTLIELKKDEKAVFEFDKSLHLKANDKIKKSQSIPPLHEI